MKIAGNSTPLEENNEFFGHLNKQMNLYSQQPANKTHLDIQLTHVNATAKRNIIEMLKSLEKLNKQGFQVVIRWHHTADDDDVLELGEIFSSMFEIEFEFMAA